MVRSLCRGAAPFRGSSVRVPTAARISGLLIVGMAGAAKSGWKLERPLRGADSTTMGDDTNTPADQKAAEADVECFRGQLGPFVVAAEKTRMAIVFTNARKADNPIVFANDAFLELTGFDREEVLGASFKSLMARGAGTQALAEIETAFAGRADREPEICYRRKDDTSFWASLYISAGKSVIAGVT